MNVNAETVEAYRAHIGAARVEKWEYDEPFIDLKLVFLVDGEERAVRDVIDLSAPGQLHLRLEEMRKTAFRQSDEAPAPTEDKPEPKRSKKS